MAKAFFMWYKPKWGDPSVEWVEKRCIEQINYKGLQKHSFGIVQLDITKDCFLAAGDDYVINFWEMDSEDLLATSDAGGDLPNGDQRSSEDVPKTIEVLKSTKTSKIKEISEPAQLQSLLLPSSVKMAKMLKLMYMSSNHAILALASNAIHLLWRWPHKSKATRKNPPQLWHPISGTLMTNDLTDVRTKEAKPCFALSKNDSYLILTSGGQVSLFSIATFKGHSKPITGLAFSSLSNLLVFAGEDDQIIVWQCNKWISKRSSFLQLPTGTTTKELSEIEVQFHQDQIHFLVVHELKLVCMKQSSFNVLCSHVIYPLVVATNPNEPNQFALGLTDGTVHVYEPLESDGEWGEKSQCNDSTTSPAIGSSSKSTPACY